MNWGSPANKYRNKKVTVDGILFDSKKESSIYLDLKAQQQQGELTFEMQKQFELIPAQRGDDGKVIERACTYKADFSVTYTDGEVVVIDAKGNRGLDQKYPIKRKLMLWVHHIKIKEV